MPGIGFPNNLNPETTKVLDDRCAGTSTETNTIPYPAQGLLRYETDNDTWKYYNNSSNWVNLINNTLDNNFTNVNFTSLTSGDLIKYDGSNFINFAPTYLDGAGITDNSLIKVVGGSTVQTSLEETSTINTSTSLNIYIPLTGGIDMSGGSIETEIFNTNKTRMHLTTGGIAYSKGITITSDGRVGIGVVEPADDLHLDGNFQLDTGGNQRSKIMFYDGQKQHEHAEIDALGEGANGGALLFYTKVDNGSVTEKLRINNIGAIGIGGANYGNPNQVLVSNGIGSAVSWADQTDTTYSAGTGVSINGSNQISIGQSVGTGDSPTFISIGLNKNYSGVPTMPSISFNDTQISQPELAKIEAENATSFGGNLSFYTKRNTNTTYSGQLRKSLSIAHGGGVTITSDIIGLIIENESGNEQGLLYNDTTNNYDFIIDTGGSQIQSRGILFKTGGGFDRLRITNDGKIGIGTNTPSEILDVKGNIQITDSNGAKILKITNIGEIDIGGVNGNPGQVLTSNGSGSAVSWASPVAAKGYLLNYTTISSGTYYDLDLATAFDFGTYLQTTNNVTSFVAPTTGVYFVNVVMRLVSTGDKIYIIRAELRETIDGTTTLKQVYILEPSLSTVTTDSMRQISITFSNHLHLTAQSLLSARVVCSTTDSSTWDITHNEENTSFSVHRV